MEAETLSNTSKPQITIAFIGLPGAGKSALIQRILYDLQLTAEHDDNFLHMHNVAEREFQSPYTKSVSRHTIELDHVVCHLVDTPGRMAYLHNMISGIALADVIVVVVSSTTDVKQFDDLKEMIIVPRCIVKRPQAVMFVYNQIDGREFDVEHYTKLSNRVANWQTKWNPVQASFLRLSAKWGEKFIEDLPDDHPLSSIPGPHRIIKELGKLLPPHRDTQGPLRVCIHEVHHNISGFGVVLVGLVCQGTIRKGMQVRLGPWDIITKVQSLEVNLEPVDHADAGIRVGIHVRDVCLGEVLMKGKLLRKLRRGIVVSDENDAPLLRCEEFTAKFTIHQFPGKRPVQKVKKKKKQLRKQAYGVTGDGSDIPAGPKADNGTSNGSRTAVHAFAQAADSTPSTNAASFVAQMDTRNGFAGQSHSQVDTTGQFDIEGVKCVRVGTVMMMHCHTARVPVQVTKLVKKSVPIQGKQKGRKQPKDVERPKHILVHEQGMAVLKPLQPVCVEPGVLGRFVLVQQTDDKDNPCLVAIAAVESIVTVK